MSQDQLLTGIDLFDYIGCKVKTIDKCNEGRANANGSKCFYWCSEGVLVVSLHAGGQAEKGGLQMGMLS